jgi:hypothetical protein
MSKTLKHNAEQKRIRRLERNNRNNVKTNLRKFADYITEEYDDEFDIERTDSLYSRERSKS